MEELVPIFEKEGVQLNIEPHPGGLGRDAASGGRHDPHHRLEERQVPLLRAAHVLFRRRHGRDDPRRGADCSRMSTSPTPTTTRPRRACATSAIRRAREVTIHQHMDIGQGEIDWDVFFSSLAAVGFDGIMTSCVFAWEERADESGRFMREDDAAIRRQILAQSRRRERSRPPRGPDALERRKAT